jgi:hypothetical protein
MSEYLDELHRHGLRTVLYGELHRQGIDTREKVAALTIDDLLDMRNIGSRCIESLISSVYAVDGTDLDLDLTYQQGGEYLDGLLRHGLHLRLCNRLIREGVTTRDQLMNIAPDDLLDWWGIGERLVESLVIAMAVKGDRMAPSPGCTRYWDAIADVRIGRSR